MRQAILVLALSACHEPTMASTILPSGQVGYIVECSRAADCWATAGDTCLHGYRWIDEESSTEAHAYVGGASIHRRISMMFECTKHTNKD